MKHTNELKGFYLIEMKNEDTWIPVAKTKNKAVAETYMNYPGFRVIMK